MPSKTDRIARFIALGVIFGVVYIVGYVNGYHSQLAYLVLWDFIPGITGAFALSGILLLLEHIFK